ncbi:bifunctional diaminohydroxyphosphoribosylaminopyrimidine deaminase/5-amino-6-(5-phosphoribosylamino)uracil reductase RibD [Flagellimonas algicola]|uniref:Riboflavin biosynthesis protein RibD n=1 Tax=Flagellimonas algicola TaxID=2583815 RepID=A0ABY2WPZ2_9FLAO|nr:bifunctional diaminohydroxyphosphoribosylaminopyrimidine deaminase/5-amino-6-(5-phosphoribosylamino)uracil reductase RibD [Allomuricauda algicola]TMU56825.1 bifunctional diaminohydroxyphosphoribosylaminopyrimidine deaminase/5-amino-6-(5-phosphoribosylamino)uracil reductase RibD [Allomuricauda algicola]
MNIHEKYMLRCMELGKKGLGTTAPNPMVGSVVVHDDKIIGEGYTSPYGGPHAEVNAISAVLNKELLKQSTIYVTLEPCSHFGKTPPCADLIIESEIPLVVIGLQDPHDKVAGAGINKLRDAGCQVTVGVLERECREHHKRFLTFQEKRRPYIILKWAETQDRFIAPDKARRNDSPEPFWITNTYSKQLVHQWRSEEQAILVGTQTVLDDNPKLNVRTWEGKSPIRIVLDQSLKIPSHFHVLDNSVDTILLTAEQDSSKYLDGITYELLDFTKPVANQICNLLHKHSISSLLVEGGTRTLQTFIDEGLWDEARIFKGASKFDSGILAPEISGKLIHSEKIISDTLSILQHD